MLSFQTADYCLLVWDSDNIGIQEALKALQPFVETDETRMSFTIRPFDMGNVDDKAKKVLEEASEVRGALQYEGKESGSFGYEIADTMTACANLAYAVWGENTQTAMQHYLDIVEKHNEKRGRYNDQSAE